MRGLSAGIVVLNQDRYDPAGLVVEVYDNPESAPRIERVLAVEALAARSRIIFPIVGASDRRDDRLKVVEQPTAAALGEVQVRPGVEDDPAAIGIGSALLIALHGCHDTRGCRQRRRGRRQRRIAPPTADETLCLEISREGWIHLPDTSLDRLIYSQEEIQRRGQRRNPDRSSRI
jgi:hypothetical protein